MKPFKDFFYHSQRVYEFRIKLAEVDMSEENLNKIRHALDTYGVETMAKPKRLPIQEHADFPRMGPCECHYIDVSLKYPTTTEQLTHIVAERALLDKGRVCVKTKDQDEQITAAEAHGQDRAKPLIGDDQLADEPGAQELVGQTRVGSFLKELEKNKVSKFEVAGKEKADGTTTDSLPQGTVSPVGSRQNKIPSPVKGK
jgi:hypothetical protein